VGLGGVGLRIAMLSYGFVEVTGRAVDIAHITAFSFGVGALLFIAGLVISLAILRLELGGAATRRLLARHRAPARRPADAWLPGHSTPPARSAF
jgi:hypothetical protein